MNLFVFIEHSILVYLFGLTRHNSNSIHEEIGVLFFFEQRGGYFCLIKILALLSEGKVQQYDRGNYKKVRKIKVVWRRKTSPLNPKGDHQGCQL